jgi:hypothetical protein
MEGIYSDPFLDHTLFEIDTEIEKMDYYDNPRYFIRKALTNWDTIINKAYQSIYKKFGEDTNIIESKNAIIKEWSNRYRIYLIALLEDPTVILYNGLNSLVEIMTFCNSHHQKTLLKTYKFKCPFNSNDINQSSGNHYISFFDSSYKCSHDHNIELINNTSYEYNYIGFITENKPLGNGKAMLNKLND